MPEHLSVLDVEALRDLVLERYGGSEGTRDRGGPESAVTRPRMAAHDEDAAIVQQAVSLLAGIALAHAFVDGNKQTALLAGTSFLAQNG